MTAVNKPRSGPFLVSVGQPHPFGVSRQGSAVNFAIHARVEELTLLIFDGPFSSGFTEIRLDPEKQQQKNIWYIALEGLPEKFAYAYRYGSKMKSAPSISPLWLNDPYARIYSGGERWGRPKNPVKKRSLYLDQPFDWQDDRRPCIPATEMVIYELHVRGFTCHPTSDVDHPGTYAGLTEKIPYLKSLGITTVELLPMFEFDETLIKRRNPLTGERLLNFWGYDPLGYFAPKASYASDGSPGAALNEFKQMVKSFHAAGMEIVLDVVYNHTGEGATESPLFSFRGLDDRAYYMINRKGEYLNFTGCGNTVNCNHPLVQKMIIDSLRYWVEIMHVDGFRFDLAPILSRGRDGSVHPNPPLLAKIRKDPVLSAVKLIAEAWDAAGLYQVGAFPGGPHWAEWNDKFRDTIRRFVRGDQTMVPDLATRLAGSSDLYQYSGRSPLNSINYVACHDGFTLCDLVSFSRKRNMANGEDNRDGMYENFSANHGKEGPSQRAEIKNLRKKQIKNMATLLMMAQGVPMLLAGDEFGRTQRGNNNAYCQDNEISWLDWDLLQKNAAQFRFFKYLIQFRKEHAALRRSTFFLPDSNGNHHIVWYDPGLQTPVWNKPNNFLAFHLLPIREDTDIYLMTNSAIKRQAFLLPLATPAKKWFLCVNTANHSPDDIFAPGSERLLTDQKKFIVDERSTVILIGK